MIGDPKFKAFMEKVLDVKPDAAAIADGMLQADFAKLERRILIVDAFYGASVMDMKLGHIDGFRFVSSPLVQEDAQPEEPRAKNGSLANRKTQQAKAKLPFYHKNRRF